MRVLIVDDEKHMTEYLKFLVSWKELGFDEVITLNKAHEAVNEITKQPPQLLLVDIRMPEVSGLDLAALIFEKNYDTKVIIISGYSEFDYALQAIRYNVAEYLVKPVLKNDLSAALEKLSFAPREKAQAGVLAPLGASSTVAEYVKIYIDENYYEPISLKLLAEKFDRNPSYLSANFKQVMDENLLVYLTRVRLEKAAALLLSSDLRIGNIAEMVGYQKTQHFIALFKKQTGLTPHQYRMKHVK